MRRPARLLGGRGSRCGEGRDGEGRSAAGRGGDRGTSTVELAMYMPIMFFFIFLTVQASLVFLGNQAASAAAREASRVARAGGGSSQAIADGVQRGEQYAADVGHGLLDNVTVRIVTVAPYLLLVAYGIGQWLAWGVKSRALNFMHYYFECIPFACIALAYLGWRMWISESGSFATRRLRRAFVAGYAAALVGWFLFYYPLLSAHPISEWYYGQHLWLGRSWI